MRPLRTAKIGEHVIHEYYWAASWPVYVDNRAVEGSFEQVCERLRSEVGVES